MKKSSPLLLLVVCLTLASPVHAARNRDDGNVRSREQTRVERLVHAIRNLGVAVQSWYIGTPRP